MESMKNINLTDEQRKQIAREYAARKRREYYRKYPERERRNRIRTYINFLIRENALVPETVNGKTVMVLDEKYEVVKGI